MGSGSLSFFVPAAHHEPKHDVLQINKYLREYNTIIVPAAPFPQRCVPCSPRLSFTCAHPELLKIPTVLKGFPHIVLDALIVIASNAYQESVFVSTKIVKISRCLVI